MSTIDVHDAVDRVRALAVDTGVAPTASSVANVIASTWPLLPDHTKRDLVARVIAEVSGLGRLEPLLRDDRVTDVLINGPGHVWVERGGALMQTGVELGSADEILRLVERVISPLGLRLDRSSPHVDARLADGSRLHAVLPPVAVDGPYVAIRRFKLRTVPLEALAGEQWASALVEAVRQRRTIVVSGGTGAGKTTLLNALVDYVDSAERIVTIEDAAELRLRQPHVVRLETRPGNADGVGEVSLRQLVRNALRLRPDRIIVGEVRGAEAFDMLQAINTGHLGSMTTCHANSAQDALGRLETMVLLAGVGVPPAAVRRQLHRAISLVVQVARSADGDRRVVDVLSVGTPQQ